MYKKVNILDNKYAIDTDGVVWNNSTRKALRGTTITKKNRYVKVHLDKFYAIHLLVLENFVGPRPEGYTANHKDGNRYNNSLANLEWVSHKENVRHSRSTLLHRGQYGEEIGTAKLTLEQARRVYALKDSDLTARQIRDRLKLPVSITAIKSIRRGESWQTAIQGTIPEKNEATPYVEPLKEAHNKIITPGEAKMLQENEHLLRRHGGKTGLSIRQLLTKLQLTHIETGTAYQHIRQYRMDCND